MVRKYGPGVLLLILIGSAVGYTVLKNHDAEAILQAIRSIRTPYLVLAVCLGLVFTALEGVVFRLLLAAGKVTVSLSTCVRMAFVGFLFSGITPSSTGGQPMQVYYLSKSGVKVSDSTPVLMTTAVLYKLVLVLIGAGLCLFWNDGLAFYFGTYLWLFYLGIGLNTGVVAVLLIVMFDPRLIRTAVLSVDRLLPKLGAGKTNHQGTRRERLLKWVTEYQTAVQLLGGSRKEIAAAFVITVFQRGCAFSLMPVLYYGFGLSGHRAAAIAALQAAVIMAVDLLPLPGAAGITELVSFQVFRQVFPGACLTAAICLSRGISFYFLLLVSLVLFFYTHVTAGKES